eukprot:2373573-Prymnesium_polylepis.1
MLFVVAALAISGHYGAPPCKSDESVQSPAGPGTPIICAAKCGAGKPTNTTAHATCALRDTSGT